MKSSALRPLGFATALAFVALAALSSTFVPAHAQDELPTAREIFDRYLEATNMKALAGENSMVTTGTFGIPAQGLSGKVTIYAKAPDLQLVKIELEGIGEMLQGANGKVAWALDPMQGPQLMEGKALAMQLDTSNYYMAMFREEDMQSADVVGKTEFEGQEAYEVKVVYEHGTEMTIYFATESGLRIGSNGTYETPMGAIPATTKVENYAEFGGAMIATKNTDSMMGMQQVVEIETVSFEEIDDSVFELPEAIEALAGGE